MQMQNIQYNRIMHTVFTRDSDSAQTKSVRLDMTTDGRRRGGEPSEARPTAPKESDVDAI